MVNHALVVLAGVLSAVGCSSSEPGPASIRGRFLLRGDVPVVKPLTIDKDIECCGRVPMLSEELVVGPDRGLANVVVFIRDKNIPTSRRAALEPVRVKTDRCRYEPHVVFVQTGQELLVGGDDCASHNPNLMSEKNAPLGMLIPPKNEVSLRFSSSESVPSQLACNIHPWMKGWVVIRSNRYAAISTKDGAFEIQDVPHGTWELQFWHERFGWIENMSINGEAKFIPKGRMSVVVGPHGVHLGDIALDSSRLK